MHIAKTVHPLCYVLGGNRYVLLFRSGSLLFGSSFRHLESERYHYYLLLYTNEGNLQWFLLEKFYLNIQKEKEEEIIQCV